LYSPTICYFHLIVRPVSKSSPRIILAVLSLGGISYALLQSLVAPALPNIQHAGGLLALASFALLVLAHTEQPE